MSRLFNKNGAICLATLGVFSQPAYALDAPVGVNAPTQPAATTTSVNLPATNEGDNALNVADYPRAEKYFAAALSAKGAANEGYLRTGYGEALLWQDKVSEAAVQFKKARSLLFGKDGGAGNSSARVRLLDDMAWMAQSQNRPDQALQSALESLQACKSDPQIPALTLVSTLVHVAALYDVNSQLEKSATTFLEALAVEEKANGPTSLLAADIREQLGGVLRRLGKTQEANKAFADGLLVKFQANAPTSPYTPHPYWDDVCFRFHEGAPNCYRKFEDGRDLQIITANGVTIAASLSSGQTDVLKAGQVDISIKNDSQAPVQFLPKPPVFYVIAPKVFLASQINPSALASKIEKKGEKKAGWIRFMGANATQTQTTTMIGNGGYYGFPPVYGYGYPGYGGYNGYNNGYRNNRRNNSDMTIINTQVPDYAAQERALAKAAAVAGKAKDAADQVRNQSLGPTTLSPGQLVNGSMYYDVGKMTKAELQIPVGNALFQFDFPPQ